MRTVCQLFLGGAAVLLGVVGCGDDDMSPMDAGAGSDAGITMHRGACSTDRRVGGFVIEAQSAYSVLDGQVNNGVVPMSVPELVRQDGDCRMVRRRNPNCDPACGPGQTCDHDGQCIAFPSAIDVGRVDITGLEKAISMMPRQPGNRYFDTDIPHPVFTPTASIVLRSSGTPSLALIGHGVETLQVPSDRWTLERGQSLAVRWTAPQNARSGEVALQLTIDQHGTSPLSIQCTFADDGEGELSASLVDELIDSGVTGFPNGRLTRRTADSQTVPDGCVDLLVGSPLRMNVGVAGYTPCRTQSDCPSGQTCNTTLQRCE